MTKTNKRGLLIGLLILVLAVAAAFFLYTNKNKVATKPTYEDEIRQIDSQSDSTDPKAIEADLNDTDLTDLDKELQDIDAELNNL